MSLTYTYHLRRYGWPNFMCAFPSAVCSLFSTLILHTKKIWAPRVLAVLKLYKSNIWVGLMPDYMLYTRKNVLYFIQNQRICAIKWLILLSYKVHGGRWDPWTLHSIKILLLLKTKNQKSQNFEKMFSIFVKEYLVTR